MCRDTTHRTSMVHKISSQPAKQQQQPRHIIHSGVWPYKPCEGCQPPHLSPLHPSGMAQRGGRHVAHSAQCEVVLVGVRGVVVVPRDTSKQADKLIGLSAVTESSNPHSNTSCTASQQCWLHKQSTWWSGEYWCVKVNIGDWGASCIVATVQYKIDVGIVATKSKSESFYLRVDHQFLSQPLLIPHLGEKASLLQKLWVGAKIVQNLCKICAPGNTQQISGAIWKLHQSLFLAWCRCCTRSSTFIFDGLPSSVHCVMAPIGCGASIIV